MLGISKRPDVYRVILADEALDDLERMELFIEQRASPAIAERYIRSIRKHCETLAYAPYVGQHRPHLRKGLRSLGFKRRVSIIFGVSRSKNLVTVARIWYAGYEGKSE